MSDIPPSDVDIDPDVADGADNFTEEAGAEEKVHVEVTSTEVMSFYDRVNKLFSSND